MTPAFFDTVLASVYDSSEGAHPHDLAVLFATMAMTMLFDEAASGAAQGFQAKDYHETAYSCLQAGNFYTETSLSSLICLHLLGSFLINSDDKRLPDGIFPITGLGVRLAIIAGYHRDKETAHAGTRPEEADWRRRIWHELLALERVHCLTALLPGSIAHDHYDTPYPSDAHKEGYFVWKWNLGVHMQRVHDFWTRVETPDLNSESSCWTLHALANHQWCKTSMPVFGDCCTLSPHTCAAPRSRSRRSRSCDRARPLLSSLPHRRAPPHPARPTTPQRSVPNASCISSTAWRRTSAWCSSTCTGQSSCVRWQRATRHASSQSAQLSKYASVCCSSSAAF